MPVRGFNSTERAPAVVAIFVALFYHWCKESHGFSKIKKDCPMTDQDARKRSDLAGRGIGNYTELEKILLNDYYPLLDRKEAV